MRFPDARMTTLDPIRHERHAVDEISLVEWSGH